MSGRLGELLVRENLISLQQSIGKILELPADKRVEGTAATVALAIAGGADIVRVHDVRASCDAIKIWQAVSA